MTRTITTRRKKVLLGPRVVAAGSLENVNRKIAKTLT